jgi:hypothetical protein
MNAILFTRDVEIFDRDVFKCADVDPVLQTASVEAAEPSDAKILDVEEG